MNIESILIYVCAFIISYLIGAIPNGIIIGKVFYHKDVREYGSHNSGGSNAGRVLGKKAGLAVIICDALKIIVTFWLVITILKYSSLHKYVSPNDVGFVCLIGACIGHCYSPYIGFKGGKAVATFAGCLLATNWLLFLVFLVIFLLVLYRYKMVSLGSVISSCLVSLLSFILFIPFMSITMWPTLNFSWLYNLALIIDTVLLLYRHKSNFERLRNHTENKITWM